MSQKKNDQTGKEFVSSSYVNTLWDQFENAVQLSRQFIEEGIEASVKSFEDAAKFNSEYRNSFLYFFDETKKANEAIISQQENAFKLEFLKNNAFANQWQDLVNRWEKIMITPTKSTFDLLNRLEKKSVENNKVYFELLQKQRLEGYNVFDEYFKLVRKTHERLTVGLEDSVKELVSSSNK